MLDALGEIVSYKTIENVTDWDQYGLEAPLCTITVTTDTTHVLDIGNETSMGGERYFSTGDGNVYLVDSSILDPFCYELYDVLKYESIPPFTDVTGMEVDSDAQSYAVTCKENSGLAYFGEYAWIMDDKVVDTELTEDLISTLLDVSWIGCVNYNADDLSVYGLEDPVATITLNYIETVSVSTGEVDEEGDTVFETREDPTAFVLEIGGTVGNYRYAKIPDSNMIYTIDGDMVDTLLNTTYYDLRPDDVLLMDWEEVTSVDITLDGETYTLAKETRSTTDEDGNSTEETVYTLNDTQVEFEAVQTALDSLESTGYATGTPDGTEEIRFLIRRNTEDFQEIELAFYRYDSTSCMTTLNGETTVFTEREGIVDLIEQVNSIVLN